MFPNGRLIMKYDRTIIFLIMFVWFILASFIPAGKMQCYDQHIQESYTYYYTISQITYDCPLCLTQDFYYWIPSIAISMVFACFMTCITVLAISFIIFIYNKTEGEL